jgi:type IV pilus assembly protein PilC
VANTILTSYFKSLALLVHGGVHVVSALRLAQESIGNKPLYLITYDIMHHVEEGLSLSEAFGKYPNYFSSEIGALLSVGQESGTMEFMFSRISDLYKERVQRRLTIMATVVQPALMLVLGGLITFLIVAVYLPIFTLSSVVG